MLGLFADAYVVPDQRPQTVVLVLKETPTAPAICFKAASGVEQALMILTIGAPLACTWWGTNAPSCEMVALPGLPDRVMGHEIRHCFDRDYHGPLGL